MEHNHTEKKNMRDRILEKIESRELSMRPKIYFTLKIAALVVVALATLIISIFIFNFILFSIRINSHDSLLSFGPRGITTFIFFFPWWLLLFDIALVALLEWLVRSFRFGYRVPILYLLLGILALTTLTALALDRGTDLNDRLLVRADHHELFFADEFYEGARRPMPGSGVCICTITGIEGSTLTVADSRSGTTTSLTVLLPANDPRATTSELLVGDTVFIAGDVDDGVIRAFGVRKLHPGVQVIIHRGPPPQN